MVVILQKNLYVFVWVPLALLICILIYYLGHLHLAETGFGLGLMLSYADAVNHVKDVAYYEAHDNL